MNRFKRGFTLLEITLSITIFALGIMGIIALFPQGLGSMQKTIKDGMIAVAAQAILAEKRIELRNLAPDQEFDLSLLQKQGLYPGDLDQVGLHVLNGAGEPSAFVDFSYSIETSPFLGGAGDRMLLELTIEDNQTGRQRQFQSVISREG